MQSNTPTSAAPDRATWTVRSTLCPMASAELSSRVEKVVGYPPLSEMDDFQRREFHQALLEAATPPLRICLANGRRRQRRAAQPPCFGSGSYWPRLTHCCAKRTSRRGSTSTLNASPHSATGRVPDKSNCQPCTQSSCQPRASQ